MGGSALNLADSARERGDYVGAEPIRECARGIVSFRSQQIQLHPQMREALPRLVVAFGFSLARELEVTGGELFQDFGGEGQAARAIFCRQGSPFDEASVTGEVTRGFRFLPLPGEW
jgi:hypothetical protein